MPYDKRSLNDFVQRQGGNLSTLGQVPSYTGAPGPTPNQSAYQSANPNAQFNRQMAMPQSPVQGQMPLQQGPVQRQMQTPQAPVMQNQMQDRGMPQYPLQSLGMPGQQTMPQQAMQRQAMVQRAMQQRAMQQRMAEIQRMDAQRRQFSPLDRMMNAPPPNFRR